MGKCRDIFGRLSYTATNSNKSVFSVTKYKSGPVKIIKHEPYYNTDAVIFDESKMAFWETAPEFDSFVKAVQYLKENLDYFL